MLKQYDLICSLGGNCSVAHNLRYRNMRPFSLPFDWVYMKDEMPIKYLIEGFADNFQNLCKFDNLERVPDTTEHKLIYRDTYSGYYFPNHFSQEIENSDEYHVMYKKLTRRINRLIDTIKNSDTILFILSLGFHIDTHLLEELQTTLLTLFPNKQIDIIFLQFCTEAKSDYPQTFSNITQFSYSRKYNDYDFSHTNFEWNFLDNIKWRKTDVSKKFPIKLASFSFFSYRLKLLLDRKK